MIRPIWQFMVLATLATAAVAQQTQPDRLAVITDAHGRPCDFQLAGESLPVRLDIRVPTKDWSSFGRLNPSKSATKSQQDDRQVWQGVIEVTSGKRCRYEQSLTTSSRAAEVDLKVTPETDIDSQGVYVWVDLPIAEFAGGTSELTTVAERGKPQVKKAGNPTTLPDPYIFLGGRATGIHMGNATGQASFDLRFSRPVDVTMQDNRKWSGQDYSILIKLCPGPLKAGQATELRLTVTPLITPDTRPAHLALDAGKVRYRFDGFGGNYCFDIDSPPAQFTLDHLRVAWARIEMLARDWQPEPSRDVDPAADMDLKALAARDQPGSRLRRRFEFDRQLQQKGLPLVSSVWWLPEWLYADGGAKNTDGHRRIVPRDRWPDLARLVGSYLLYAKKQYGIEPAVFSFNEADIGVMLLLTGEEHRDLIKLLGAHFEKLGLKTKLLLGDTASAGGLKFTQPAASDPEALRYVGAVAFHSWGGAEPKTYAAWADLAERLKLPLLVTEMGVDANWAGRPTELPGYWLRELRMYQELLLYARPIATMQWEFTGDYSLVGWTQPPGGEIKIQPTDRYYLVQQLSTLTPPKADVLTTTSDHPKVLMTAAIASSAGGPADKQTLTIHVANLAAGRVAEIAGLPPTIRTLRVFLTSSTDHCREVEPVQVDSGRVKLTLQAQSLTTLTHAEP